MNSTLHRILEGDHFAIVLVPDGVACGEVDSAEDLLPYQVAGGSGASK